jgi:membrane protease YdiL (CAAX protease family)
MENTTNRISKVKILFWVIAILIVPQFIVGLTLSLVNALSVINLRWLDEPYAYFVGVIVGFPISIYLLMAAEKTKSIRTLMNRLSVKKINTKNTAICVSLTLCFYASSELLFAYFGIPEESFMEGFKELLSNPITFALMLISTSIVAPILEELVFRGWLFNVLRQKNISASLAVIMPSLFFSLIHLQYQHASTFVAIFISGIMFGLFRIKMRSVSYSIMSHAIMNLCVTLSLFFI